MQIDLPTLLAQVQTLAASFGPWGLLVAAGIGVYLRFFRPSSPAPAPAPAPAPGTDPVPSPAPSPAPTPGSSFPLMDLAVKLLGGIAARRFPHLSQDEAVARHLVEQTTYGYYADDAAREKQAEQTTKK